MDVGIFTAQKCFTASRKALAFIKMATLFLLLFSVLLSVTGCSNKKDLTDATLIASGTTGSLTWTLSKDGTLTISGNGEMPNYESLLDDIKGSVSSSPWGIYSEDITNVIIKDGVTGIGDWAFYRCCNFTSIDIPNSVTRVGVYAFNFGGLSSVTIGNSVATIGREAFILQGGGLNEIIIHQKIPPKLDGNVFGFLYHTGIKLFVPDGSEEAYRAAPGWENFLIIGTVGEPSPVIAADTELSSVMQTLLFTWWLYKDGTLIINGTQMPRYNSIVGRGGYGFAPWYDNEEYRNSIISVIIEEGMANISKQAFYQCSNINSITIPNSVTDISDEETFTGCQNIAKIVNFRVVPQIISSNVFEGVNKTVCILLVPDGSVEAYRTVEGWKDFANIKTIQ